MACKRRNGRGIRHVFFYRCEALLLLGNKKYHKKNLDKDLENICCGLREKANSSTSNNSKNVVLNFLLEISRGIILVCRRNFSGAVNIDSLSCDNNENTRAQKNISLPKAKRLIKYFLATGVAYQPVSNISKYNLGKYSCYVYKKGGELVIYFTIREVSIFYRWWSNTSDAIPRLLMREKYLFVLYVFKD